MLKSIVELDFFRINEKNAARLLPVEQRSSIRGIQGAISKIDPRLLRSVIASGGSIAGIDARTTESAADAPSAADRARAFRSPSTAPLTIFYNGTVAVFDVHQDMAEAIIKLAEEGNVAAGGDRAELGREAGLVEKLEAVDGDLPIARRKSLQRFLEKRKGRLTDSGPYGSGAGSTKVAAEMVVTTAI